MRHIITVGIDQQCRQVNCFGPWSDAVFPYGKQITASNQFVHRADAHQRHALPQFLRHKTHEIDYVFRFSGKALPEFRILRCHSHRAGIQIAHTHHAAAEGNQRRRGKAKFFGTQHTGHSHIAPGHQLAVSLNDDLLTKAVFYQRLVRLGNPQFPGQAGVLNGRQGGSAGSPVITRDQDNLRPGFRHTAGNCAHPRLRHQLHTDSRMAVGVFQVENQLSQIFDGVNIVVRRRADQ